MYAQSNIAKAIQATRQSIELTKQTIALKHELAYTLVRIHRALDPVCWVDRMSKTELRLAQDQEAKIFRDRKDSKDLPFYLMTNVIDRDVIGFQLAMRKQWEKDRAQLIKEGKITEVKN